MIIYFLYKGLSFLLRIYIYIIPSQQYVMVKSHFTPIIFYEQKKRMYL